MLQTVTGLSKVHSECEVECKSTFYFTFFPKYSVFTFHSHSTQNCTFHSIPFCFFIPFHSIRILLNFIPFHSALINSLTEVLHCECNKKRVFKMSSNHKVLFKLNVLSYLILLQLNLVRKLLICCGLRF